MTEDTTRAARLGAILVRRAGGAAHRPAPAIRSQTTRIVHLLLLLVVLHQLINSEFIRLPLPGLPPRWPYLLHEYVGLLGFGVVFAFWSWTLLRRGETSLGRLFPWFTAWRIRDVVDDLAVQVRLLLRGRGPSHGSGALASAIHGLGLLTVTAMVVTGTIYFLAPDGTALSRAALLLHRLISNLMWAYLIGHAGLAALHQLLGDNVFARMFWFRARR